jgi:hypothetical protein
MLSYYQPYNTVSLSDLKSRRDEMIVEQNNPGYIGNPERVILLRFVSSDNGWD